MRKRQFLRWLGMLGLSAIGPACVRSVSPSSPTPPIMVIGAGLAGLAVARTLHQQGYGVMVLEGRDRLGGRTWTSNHWGDLPLDLGASWIHGVEGNPLTTLADTIAADRRPTRYERNIVYNTQGDRLSVLEEKRLEQLQEDLFQVIRRAQEYRQDRPLRDVIAAAFPLEPDPSPELQHRQNLINFILSRDLEQEYGGSVEALSTFWYDSDEGFGGDDVLLVDGFETIVKALAQELRIALGQVVQEIHWRETPLRIVTTTAEFLAERVVVTLPLGVLQGGKVRFVPALPAVKQKAIAQLGMGVLNKCCLRFEEAFWPAHRDWLEYIPREHGAWTEWVSLMRSLNHPVLIGFNAGDRGRAIEAWSDGQIVASAMDTLKTIYGSTIPDPVDFQITRWSGDPFALGSYSFNRIGSHPRQRQDLAQPLDQKLFFAGEATEKKYFGTAHGAYLSGIRAAQEIHQS